MTRERVTQIQGCFITIGSGEGQLRTGVVPPPSNRAVAAPPTTRPPRSSRTTGPSSSGDVRHGRRHGRQPRQLRRGQRRCRPSRCSLVLRRAGAGGHRPPSWRADLPIPNPLRNHDHDPPAPATAAPGGSPKLVLLVAASCGSDSDSDDLVRHLGWYHRDHTAAAASGDLVGTFGIDPGADGADGAGRSRGRTSRMVQSGGTVADGPFVPNGDSTATDQTWHPARAGHRRRSHQQVRSSPVRTRSSTPTANAWPTPSSSPSPSSRRVPSITTSDTDRRAATPSSR